MYEQTVLYVYRRRALLEVFVAAARTAYFIAENRVGPKSKTYPNIFSHESLRCFLFPKMFVPSTKSKSSVNTTPSYPYWDV